LVGVTFFFGVVLGDALPLAFGDAFAFLTPVGLRGAGSFLAAFLGGAFFLGAAAFTAAVLGAALARGFGEVFGGTWSDRNGLPPCLPTSSSSSSFFKEQRGWRAAERRHPTRP
jgi:hypothetical protein